MPGPSGGVFLIPKVAQYGASVFGFAGVVLIGLFEFAALGRALKDSGALSWLVLFVCTCVLGPLGLILAWATVDTLGFFDEALWISGGRLCAGDSFRGWRLSTRTFPLDRLAVVGEAPPPRERRDAPGGALTVAQGGALRSLEAWLPLRGPDGGRATAGLLLRSGRRRIRVAKGLEEGQAAALADQLVLRFGLRRE